MRTVWMGRLADQYTYWFAIGMIFGATISTPAPTAAPVKALRKCRLFICDHEPFLVYEPVKLWLDDFTDVLIGFK